MTITMHLAKEEEEEEEEKEKKKSNVQLTTIKRVNVSNDKKMNSDVPLVVLHGVSLAPCNHREGTQQEECFFLLLFSFFFFFFFFCCCLLGSVWFRLCICLFAFSHIFVDIHSQIHLGLWKDFQLPSDTSYMTMVYL